MKLPETAHSSRPWRPHESTDAPRARPWRKRRLAHLFERYVANPQLRLALRLGVAPRTFALLETTGRTSGRPRQTPVGNFLCGDTFWLVAEHGRHCQYVKNLLADPRVRVKVGREWRTGTASLPPDDDGLERRHQLEGRRGLAGRFDGAIFRAVATEPLTIRIDLEPDAARPRNGTAAMQGDAP